MDDKEIQNKLVSLDKKITNIEEKLDTIIKLIEEDVKPNCEKMNTHIDFVDNVYDNVKNPLGFLCNKINYFKGYNSNYNLENIK